LESTGSTPTSVIESVAPRFFSPATACYSPEAIQESLTPGGETHVHPYALIKLRGDPRIIAQAAVEDRRKLLKVWRPSTVAEMAKPEIESQCRALGVPLDLAGFLSSLQSYQSAWAISQEWAQNLPNLKRSELEFLGLAACELWHRLCPEHPSVEMLDDWICAGYGNLARSKPVAALDSWLKAWAILQSWITPDLLTFEDLEHARFRHMSQRLVGWAHDFRSASLHHASAHVRCREVGIDFIQGVLTSLPGEASDPSYHADLAELRSRLPRS